MSMAELGLVNTEDIGDKARAGRCVACDSTSLEAEESEGEADPCLGTSDDSGRDSEDDTPEREMLDGTIVLVDEAEDDEDDDEDDDEEEDGQNVEFRADEDGARRATGLLRAVGVLLVGTGALWVDGWSCSGGAKASIVVVVCVWYYASNVFLGV